MAAKTIKEEQVGEPPMCHSIEMLDRGDGTIEVVARLQPDSEGGTYAEPMRSIDVYINRAEAEFRYKTILGLMKKVGSPA